MSSRVQKKSSSPVANSLRTAPSEDTPLPANIFELNNIPMAFNSSGRQDFAPYTTPAQSHHPLRGFVGNWRPREFRFIQKLCPMELFRLPKFTSGRRDLNPRFPIRHELCGLRSVRCERVISPLPRFQFATKTGYNGFYWGLVAD